MSDLIKCPCGCGLLTNGSFVCSRCDREVPNCHHDALYDSCAGCADEIGHAADNHKMFAVRLIGNEPLKDGGHILRFSDGTMCTLTADQMRELRGDHPLIAPQVTAPSIDGGAQST